MKISIIQEDITQLDIEAIVNPANSYGYMGGGVAEAIKKKGGFEIETEAASFAPIMLGMAVVTSAGKLPCRKIIHSPTMEQPSGKSFLNNVTESTHAALEIADDNEIKRLAMPGMGTGTGGVPKDKAAEAMISVIVNFEPKHLKEIMLVDTDMEMVKAWRKVYEGKS